MSGQRVSPSGTGPNSGFRNMRLMWSAISIRSPGRRSRRTPPAALLTTSARIPSLVSTRTGRITSPGGCPSYMWTRPLRPTAGTPASVPATILPSWPTTVEGGQCGSSVARTVRAPSNRPAKPPRPEPRITPTSGSKPLRSSRRAAAASSTRRSIGSSGPAPAPAPAVALTPARRPKSPSSRSRRYLRAWRADPTWRGRGGAPERSRRYPRSGSRSRRSWRIRSRHRWR